MSVLQFRPKPAPIAKQKSGEQYYCKRCDGGEFRLTALGMCHCASCGALMRNLLVVPTKGES